MSFELPKEIELNARVRHRRVGEDGVVVCMHTGNVLVVNPVGIHIIEQLSKQLDNQQIVESICKEFDVTKKEALKGFEDYTQQLNQHDVVSVIAEDV